MPALFTHYELGQDVITNSSSKFQKETEKSIEYYNMFNQGWDNLFYYPIGWKHLKKLAVKAQTNNVDNFFVNLISYIKDNNLENDSNCTAMVYGFINHYIADTIIHPFINYQAKVTKIPHSKVEFIIDNKLKHSNNNKIYRTLIPKLKFNKTLINMIDKVFLDTYNKKNIGKKFNKSHNNSYYLYRYILKDNHGFKSFILKLIDLLTFFKKTKLNKLTYHIKKNDEQVLNIEKNKWFNLNNKKEIYNYSFEELYIYTLNICIKLNKIAYKIIHENNDINELLQLINLINIKNIPKVLQR